MVFQLKNDGSEIPLILGKYVGIITPHIKHNICPTFVILEILPYGLGQKANIVAHAHMCIF